MTTAGTNEEAFELSFVHRGQPAVDQRVDTRLVARYVSLKPSGGAFACHLFHGDQRCPAHDRHDARPLRRACQDQIAAVGRQRIDTHWRNAERAAVALAEQLHRLRALRDIAQHPGRERVVVKHRPVVAQRGVVLGGARDVAKDGPGQAPTRCCLEVVQRQHVAQRGGQGDG